MASGNGTVPWHRAKGETGAAYEAFRAYLGAGPDRTVPGAYRKFRGDESAPASHQWAAWSRKFRWEERAAAWERRGEECRDRGREGAEVRRGADWAKRREEFLESGYRSARRMVLVGNRVLKEKALAQRMTKEQRAAREAEGYKEPGMQDAERASKMVLAGLAAGREVVQAAMPSDAAAPGAMAMAAATDPGLQDVLQRRLAEFRAPRLAAVRAFPSSPPGSATGPGSSCPSAPPTPSTSRTGTA